MHDAQIRVAIAGAGGRMGRQLIQATLQMDGVALGAALEREGSSLIYMAEDLVKRSENRDSGFYLYNHEDLFNQLKKQQKKRESY